jgi:hypothetical protein
MSTNATATPASRNAWDVVVVGLVLLFLGGITVFLVQKYGTDAEKVGSLLGILVPAVGAVFGVTIGYQAGTRKGEAEGQATAKKQIKDELGERLGQLEGVIGKVVGKIHREGASPRGREAFELERVEFDAADLQRVREQLAEARGYVNSLA